MKKGNDLGKYDLNQLLRNPATIHLIQDGLQALKGTDILSEAYKRGAKENVRIAIKQIVSDYEDNSRLVTEIVGKDILNLIEEYNGKALAENIPTELFSKPNIEPLYDPL